MRHVAQTATSRPPPVSLLDTPPYVTDSHIIPSYEALTRAIP